MKTVLVTGKNGQLGQCLQSLVLKHPNIHFIFKSSSELDITSKGQIDTLLGSKQKIDYCINCAAYTAVDKAESDFKKAFTVNTLGTKNLAEVCNKHRVTLIHISTDFVFDGKSSEPYLETSTTNPLGVYGRTKLKGELEIKKNLHQHFIVRTSWLYSEFGNNFLKTMLGLANEQNELGVVGDQKGSPTYAKDLAKVLIEFVETDCKAFGTYHYSNKGEVSWYDFAKEIFEQKEIRINLKRIKTEDYQTPAKRPKYSVLDTSKIESTLNLEIPNWSVSLSKCISSLENET